MRWSAMELYGSTLRDLGWALHKTLSGDDGHTLTFGVGDLLALADEFDDASFDRIGVSNVPDYVALPPVMLSMRRLLRRNDESCILFHNLLNGPFFASVEHMVRTHTRLPRGSAQLPIMYGMRIAFFGPRPNGGTDLSYVESSDLTKERALADLHLFRVEAPVRGERSARDERTLRALLPDYLVALARHILAPAPRRINYCSMHADPHSCATLVNLIVLWLNDLNVPPHIVHDAVARLLGDDVLRTSVPPQRSIFDEWDADDLSLSSRPYTVKLDALRDELTLLLVRANAQCALACAPLRERVRDRRTHRCTVVYPQQLARPLVGNALFCPEIPNVAVLLTTAKDVYAEAASFRNVGHYSFHVDYAPIYANGGNTRALLPPPLEPTRLLRFLLDADARVRVITCVRSRFERDRRGAACLVFEFDVLASDKEVKLFRVLPFSVESGQSLYSLEQERKKYPPTGVLVKWSALD